MRVLAGESGPLAQAGARAFVAGDRVYGAVSETRTMVTALTGALQLGAVGDADEAAVAAAMQHAAPLVRSCTMGLLQPLKELVEVIEALEAYVEEGRPPADIVAAAAEGPAAAASAAALAAAAEPVAAAAPSPPPPLPAAAAQRGPEGSTAVALVAPVAPVAAAGTNTAGM